VNFSKSYIGTDFIYIYSQYAHISQLFETNLRNGKE